MAVLKIFNDIQSENEKKACQFWGDAEGVCFKDVDEFVAGMDADDNVIEVRLHCDGGDVIEGWGIYDKLRSTGKEITTIVEGNAASMATVIMMAAPKERRKAYSSAQILVHNPWICPYSFDYSMTADELRKAADDLQAQQDKILNLYVERCECDREEMQALMNENKYIDTTRAKELGLIGEIIAPASASAKKGVKFNNKKNKAMAKEEKVEVKASLMSKILAKLGIKSIDEFEVKGMDLSTADGQTLTIEREEGEPQVGDKASPDGEFKMPDGSTIVVSESVITDIKKDSDPAASAEDDDKVAELEKKVEDLEAEVDELKSQLEAANAKAKTTEELRILNAVKIAGGEKALAKLSSSYQPQGRKPSGGNASSKANEGEDMSPMRAEIEARKNGTYKSKKGKGNKKPDVE